MRAVLLLALALVVHSASALSRALLDDLLHLDDRASKLWYDARYWACAALALAFVLIVVPLWVILLQHYLMRHAIRELDERVKKLQ